MSEEKIKRQIRQAREKKDLTQTEMAERLGIDRNTYRSIENGKTRIMSPYVDRMAEILEVDAMDLVFGYKQSPDSQKSEFEDYKLSSEKRLKNLTNSYEDRLAELMEKYRQLEETAGILRQQVRDKQLIIDMLNEKLRSLDDTVNFQEERIKTLADELNSRKSS